MLTKKSIFILIMLSTFAFGSTKTLYDQKCGICHGIDGKTLVMGKSKEIKGMPIEEILKAMEDYASGDRKSIVMVQGLKKSFMNKYDSETLYNLAKYINEL